MDGRCAFGAQYASTRTRLQRFYLYASLCVVVVVT